VVLSGFDGTLIWLQDGSEANSIYPSAVSLGDFELKALVFQLLSDTGHASEFVNYEARYGRKVVCLYFFVE